MSILCTVLLIITNTLEIEEISVSASWRTLYTNIFSSLSLLFTFSVCMIEFKKEENVYRTAYANVNSAYTDLFAQCDQSGNCEHCPKRCKQILANALKNHEKDIAKSYFDTSNIVKEDNGQVVDKDNDKTIQEENSDETGLVVIR